MTGDVTVDLATGRLSVALARAVLAAWWEERPDWRRVRREGGGTSLSP